MGKLIETIKNLMDNRIIRDNPKSKEILNLIKERIEDNEFKIAVVGEFSSGKSTFINALIGKDILKHATVETTATVTYIHNVKTSNNLCGKCRVNYSNGETKLIYNYDDLKEYTTTLSNEDVANTIASVEIFMHFIDLEEDIIIVDTPGLNGVLDKHREVTIEEIQKSDACIYLFQKNGITESDEEFIRFISNYQNKFIFVQNFIDELREVEGEFVDDKLNSIRSYIENSVFENNEFVIDYSVKGVSALKALVGKDHNIHSLYNEDLVDLTNEQREKYLDESKIKDIELEMGRILKSEKNKEIKYKSACHAIVSLLQEIIKREKENQKLNNQLLQEDSDYKDKEKAIELINNINNRKETIVEKLDNLVYSQFVKNKKLLLKDIENNITNIKEKISNIIQSEINYDEFDKRYRDSFYTNEIQKLIDLYNKKLEESEYYCFQDINKSMLDRLNEYSKYSTKKITTLKDIDFADTFVKKIDLTFQGKKTELDKFKIELVDNLANKEIKEENLLELCGNLAIKKNEQDSRKVRLEESDRNKVLDESALSGRPLKREDGHNKEDYQEKRSGILGGIVDIIIGPKHRIRNIPRYNDSKGLEWDRKKREIVRNNFNEKQEIQKELDILKKKEIEYENKINKDKLSIENSDRRVKYLKNQIKIKEEEVKIYETSANKEYLSMRKKHLINEIHDYLFEKNQTNDCIIDILKNKVNVDIIKNTKNIQKVIRDECKAYITEETERLKAIIDGNIEGLNEKYISREKYVKNLGEILDTLKGEL